MIQQLRFGAESRMSKLFVHTVHCRVTHGSQEKDKGKPSVHQEISREIQYVHLYIGKNITQHSKGRKMGSMLLHEWVSQTFCSVKWSNHKEANTVDSTPIKKNLESHSRTQKVEWCFLGAGQEIWGLLFNGYRVLENEKGLERLVVVVVQYFKCLKVTELYS